MKKDFGIGAVVIAAYFLVLPFLFAVHTTQHEVFNAAQDELVIEQKGTHCELCDLYHSQNFRSEKTDTNYISRSFLKHYFSTTESAYPSSENQYPQRGPPIV
ncbi:MAG: hypothetical protein ABJG78_12340 [Cyclobacteriaceae bacterium]